MNSKSLNLIEEVVTPFGMWDSLEIAQDSIYLEFSDVELGNPKYNDSLNLSFRFSDKSFIVFFYNNIWDAEFLANFDFKNHFINEDFVLKVVVGGNKMDFFFNNLKLDSDSLKELSNQWVLYFLKYRLKRNIIMKDPMCEHNTLI